MSMESTFHWKTFEKTFDSSRTHIRGIPPPPPTNLTRIPDLQSGIASQWFIIIQVT